MYEFVYALNQMRTKLISKHNIGINLSHLFYESDYNCTNFQHVRRYTIASTPNQTGKGSAHKTTIREIYPKTHPYIGNDFHQSTAKFAEKQSTNKKVVVFISLLWSFYHVSFFWRQFCVFS